MKYYARKCDHCKKGMNEGYVWDVGYACSDKCLYVEGYTKELFEEDYKADRIYYTEWLEDFEGNTEDGYYTKNGKFISREDDIMSSWIS